MHRFLFSHYHSTATTCPNAQPSEQPHDIWTMNRRSAVVTAVVELQDNLWGGRKYGER